MARAGRGGCQSCSSAVNVFGQLGFLGNTNDTVWLLITLTLNIIVLYALIVRWHDSQPELETR